MKRRILGLLIPAIAAGSIAAAPAKTATTFADAPGPFTVNCLTVSFQAVTAGGGIWAPARAVDGTRWIVPAAFKEAVILGEDSEGQRWVGDNFATASKGQRSTSADAVACSFSWTVRGTSGTITWTETTIGHVAGVLSSTG